MAVFADLNGWDEGRQTWLISVIYVHHLLTDRCYSPRKPSKIFPFSAFVEVKFETLETHVCVFTNICHFCLAFKEVVNFGHILCQFN